MQRIALLLRSRLLAMIAGTWIAAVIAIALPQEAYARFDRQALDSMLAPVALYPDHLLSQVLMAATYPHEVEQAAQWSRERPGLSGDAAVRTSEGWDWDPSVRSLTAFPHVLDSMVQHMRWTQDLGEAFLAQPQDVMDTVQRLRFRAYEAGTLTSTEYTRVIHTGSSLTIESVHPQIVHVPHYDPRVVYGSWWWPAYPPVYWTRWHGYYDPPGRFRAVHWGPGIGIASGFFFGGFDWPRRQVRIVNVHSYYYSPRTVVVERPVGIHRPVHALPAPGVHSAPSVWRHDVSRRRLSQQHDQQSAQHSHTRPQPAPEPRREAAPPATTPARTAPPAPMQQATHEQARPERQARRDRHADDDSPTPRKDQQPARRGSDAQISVTAPAERALPAAPRTPVSPAAQQTPTSAPAAAPDRNDASERSAGRQRSVRVDGEEQRVRTIDRSARD